MVSKTELEDLSF